MAGKVFSSMAILLVLVIASFAIGQGEDESKPGPFFKSRCSMCHTMPNPKLPTDPAWADQVLRTT